MQIKELRRLGLVLVLYFVLVEFFARKLRVLAKTVNAHCYFSGDSVSQCTFKFNAVLMIYVT